MPPQSPRRKSWTARHKVLIGFLAFCGLAFVIGIAAAIGSPSSPAASPSTPAAPAQTQTAAAANPAVANKPGFPPKTLADFRAFAATGDPSQVQQIATSTEGLPSCPEPNIYVTVSPGLTGKALEADLGGLLRPASWLCSGISARHSSLRTTARVITKRIKATVSQLAVSR